MNAAQMSLKSIRIIHLVFLLTVALYAWLPSRIVNGEAKESPLFFVVAFLMVSLTSLAAVLFFQAKMARPASDQLRLHPDDVRTAGRWRAGMILSFVFSETIILFGLALRILGVPWKLAGLFYAVGTLLLLACTPKLDLLPP